MPGSRASHAFGWWLIFSVYNLHLTGVRFTLTRLADAGLGTWRRRTIVLGLFAAVVAITLWRLPSDTRTPDFDGDSFPHAIGRWILDVTGAAPLGWALWPVKLLLGPFFADGARVFLFALGPAALVLVAHYVWVVRSVVSFEDGSIERAQKRAELVNAMRSGARRGRAPTKGRKPPFALASTGRPEFAFLWKNLLSTWPWLSARVWCWCAFAILAVTAWVRIHPEWRWWLVAYGPVALIIAGYTLFAGPQLARQDIRSDLTNADLLKTYPLPGWQIVLGEMLTPIAILTGILWLALLAAAVSFEPGPHAFQSFSPAVHDFIVACLSPAARAWLTLCAAMVVPPVVALQLFVPNASALLFPAWFQTARQRAGGGIDVMGQRLIFFAAQMLTMLLAILPAALVGGGLVFIACFALHCSALAGVWLGATSVCVVLLGELWAGLYFLGSRFEKLDLSSELRP